MGLILIMIAVVIIGILIAKSYYGNSNRSIDPRIVEARELYSKYDNYAQRGNYYRVFSLLDSIEDIYSAIRHYERSFELGVLYNNRAAAYLTVSMFADTIPEALNPFTDLSSDSLYSLAQMNLLKAILIYESWVEKFSSLSVEQISKKIIPKFLEGLDSVSPALEAKYVEARAKDIEKALIENDRRLSVCYTNLGVVFRQTGAYKEAVEHYEKALKLWDRNLDAENNLNLLLGRPAKKRNLIQKLFPPERNQP